MLKNKGGRPLKLNEDIKVTLISGVRQGLTLKAACRFAGISYSTFANWRQRKRKLLKQETNVDNFVAAIELEMSHVRREHRRASLACITRRDFRYGWGNPMSDETKQKLRVRAFEIAVENVLRRRGL